MAEYLAIDGWSEYQPLRGKGSWIKDATDQHEREKLSGLSMFARGLLQELRRVRGRTGKNIPYDITHIARAVHAIGTDRPHLHHALSTLIARGVLVVTNQQLDITGDDNKEIEKEIDKDIEGAVKSDPATPRESSPKTPSPVLVLEPSEAPTNRKPRSSEFVLPPGIPQDAWDGFEEMRRNQKKGLTNRGRGLIVKQLLVLAARGHPPGEVLDQSTERCWQGVFELKDRPNKPTGSSRESTFAEEQRRKIEKATADRARGGTA
jgi:hypothetical protein